MWLCVPEESDSWGQGGPGWWSLPLTTYSIQTLCQNLQHEVSRGFSSLETLFLARAFLNQGVR